MVSARRSARAFRILLVEDDEETRGRLQTIVDGHADLSVVAAVGELHAGLRALEERSVDVVLVDLGLPDGDGIELIRAARALEPPAEAMVITVFGDERHVLGAIEAGATGYLLKDEDPATVPASILRLLDGESPISPSIARHVLRRLRGESAHEDPMDKPLSPRETEVLELLARGFTYAEIAELLKVSVNTVTTHIQHTYRKLEVRSRSEAVFEAVQRRILNLDP